MSQVLRMQATWEQARWIARQLVPGGLTLFRGHGDSNWRLQSSFERRCEDTDWKGSSPGSRLALERRCIRGLEEVSDDYGISATNHLEWLALLQHYGCPTRLVDVTRSFYVAAYFAAEGIGRSDSCEIWCFNAMSFLADYTQATKLHSILAGASMEQFRANLPDLVANDHDLPPLLVDWRPKKLDRRMAAQQGLFLVPTRIDVPTERCFTSPNVGLSPAIVDFSPDLLDSLLPLQFRLIRIVLNRSEAMTALNDLSEMNVHAGTLFPGLAGHCRSLGTHFVNDSKRPGTQRFSNHLTTLGDQEGAE